MRYLLSIDPTCARSIRPALDRSGRRRDDTGPLDESGAFMVRRPLA
jgi:hypothetical protein